MENTNMDEYFSGKKLYGDAFSRKEIEGWYDSEAEAFAELYGKDVAKNSFYEYHNLNIFYGFNYLKKQESFDNVLGFGSSWGYEFLPIIDKIKKLTIIESSIQTRSEILGNIKPEYKSPDKEGKINFPDNSFDLITCFDTLHHIPNVTFVLNELFRVLKPGGYFLLHEPIHSMGDWRTFRSGLTTNERGIPKDYLLNIIKEANIKIVKRSFYACMTSLFIRIFKGFRFSHTKWYIYIDCCLAKLFSFNIHYHATNKWQRIAPASIFYVLKKPL